ncbi:MAG TPA: SDR family NAD(P)-dependent oxidoreductase, partial [Rubrivivax sp.]|nr:SDR family NAD(P)-dependent oxidoreductase [Rubrivivax sp.]
MFKDKVIVITGATSGIGRSLALALAEEGARLVLADSKPPEPAAAAIQGAQFQQTDVAREDDILRLIEHAYA